MKRLSNRFKQLTITKKILLGAAAVIVLAIASSSQHPTATQLNASNVGGHDNAQVGSLHPATTKTAPAEQVTTKTETEIQSIPFTSTTVQDSTLAKGTSKIKVAGVNGAETLTYNVIYTGSKQTSKKLVSTIVTTAPVTQVTAIGTYVAPPAPSCPNGTYVNSAGNTVCSPYASNSAPSGATAQCADGTYSFSQSHSGTCSHHGGVASWL